MSRILNRFKQVFGIGTKQSASAMQNAGERDPELSEDAIRNRLVRYGHGIGSYSLESAATRGTVGEIATLVVDDRFGGFLRSMAAMFPGGYGYIITNTVAGISNQDGHRQRTLEQFMNIAGWTQSPAALEAVAPVWQGYDKTEDAASVMRKLDCYCTVAGYTGDGTTVKNLADATIKVVEPYLDTVLNAASLVARRDKKPESVASVIAALRHDIVRSALYNLDRAHLHLELDGYERDPQEVLGLAATTTMDVGATVAVAEGASKYSGQPYPVKALAEYCATMLEAMKGSVKTAEDVTAAAKALTDPLMTGWVFENTAYSHRPTLHYPEIAGMMMAVVSEVMAYQGNNSKRRQSETSETLETSGTPGWRASITDLLVPQGIKAHEPIK